MRLREQHDGLRSSAARHTWSSTRDDGVESIVLAPGGGGGSSTGGSSSGGSSAFCVPPCTLPWCAPRTASTAPSRCRVAAPPGRRALGRRHAADGGRGAQRARLLCPHGGHGAGAHRLAHRLCRPAAPLLLRLDRAAAHAQPAPRQRVRPRHALVLPPVAGGGIQTLVFGVGGGADGLSNFTILPQAGGSGPPSRRPTARGSRNRRRGEAVPHPRTGRRRGALH